MGSKFISSLHVVQQHNPLIAETFKEYQKYVEQTIKITNLIVTIAMRSEEVTQSLLSRKKVMRNLKILALKINHRLRIARLLILTVLESEDQDEYLDSLNSIEVENLYQTIQSLVLESQIIQKYSYCTYEQVAFGIDINKTLSQIRQLLQQPIAITQRSICENKSIGCFLDDYFYQHTQISFDLLMNALILKYDIEHTMRSSLANALHNIFNIDFKTKRSINVYDFTLFTDFISIPQLLSLLENGNCFQYQIEDNLLKVLSINKMSDYQLARSYQPIQIQVQEDVLMQKLIAMKLFGMESLKFYLGKKDVCKIKIELAQDEDYIEKILKLIEKANGQIQSNNNEEVQSGRNIFQDETISSQQSKPDQQSFSGLCDTLSRLQQCYKTQILELLDEEIREKELQASFSIQLDSMTSYKTASSQQYFNEDIFNEFDEQPLEKRSSQQESIVGQVIVKLEKVSVQQEKLNVLRKLQKQREKKKILSERIEADTNDKDHPPQLSVKIGMHLTLKTGINNQSMHNIKQGINIEKDSAQTISQKDNTDEDIQLIIANCRNEGLIQNKLINQLSRLKSHLLMKIENIEEMLLKADLKMMEKRKNLMITLKFYEEQISEKEDNIRVMLGEIASLEMKKNWIQDDLEENTLKTIEVINISDIRIEKDNLESHLRILEKKQEELDKVEQELEREKQRVEDKKKKRLGKK